MKVEPYSLEQATLKDFMSLQLRPEDAKTIPSKEAKKNYGTKLLSGGPANSLWTHGQLLACMGILNMFPHVGEAWIFCDEIVVDHPVTLLEGTKEYLEFLVQEHQFVRVQARCDAEWFEANKFLKHLGFSLEAEMKYFGPNLEDYNQYVRIQRWPLSQQS
jgi:hypothetical protein